ncbi:MAG TPA: AMP-binding protein [Acidimicrobiales bacterium]|nr:AMP-binding protein [Acidimicrobiales bacterium]
MDQATAAASGMTLAFHAEQAPDRMAIISEHGNRTFAALNANANRLARVLRARGVGVGDSVSLVCANRPEFAEALAACTRIGVRLTTVNWHLTGEEMGYILDNSDAKAVIGDARFAAALRAAVELAPNLETRIAIGSIEGFDDYDKVIAPESGSDIDDPVLGRTMLYTSGTTGRPKGVDRPPAAQREANAAKESSDIPDAGVSLALSVGGAARQNGAAGDRHLCTGPLYHAAPLAFSLSGPLAAGCGVVLMDGWSAEETLRLVDEHKVTHTHMVATMFHRLLALPDEVKARYDLSSLRFIVHGAAPCPVAVKKALMEWLGPIVYEYYAATEGGGTFVGPDDWLTKPGTVGKPFHPALMQIHDAEGNVLGPNEIGTVYMRAPSTGRFRYYKDDDKTASSYRGDYFTLGDHGYLDDDGYLFLTGRSAELIISGGVNIYPAEVDAVLLTHPAVGDAGTIGIPNDEWGEEVKAVIELKEGVEGTPELAAEILAFAKERLASFKCPRTIDFVAELPRHDNGKLYRRKLRELYVSDEDPTGHKRAV